MVLGRLAGLDALLVMGEGSGMPVEKACNMEPVLKKFWGDGVKTDVSGDHGLLSWVD